MKKFLSITIVVSMLIAVCSCNNNSASSFDAARAQVLIEVYQAQNELTIQEWDELSQIYSSGVDQYEQFIDSVIKQAEEGAVMDNVKEMLESEENIFDQLAAINAVFINAYARIEDEAIKARVSQSSQRLSDKNTYLTRRTREIYSDETYNDLADDDDEDEIVETDGADYGQIILTAKSLGPIGLGTKKSEIPASVPGLYDSSSYSAYDHDYDMDIPLNFKGYSAYKLNGKTKFYLTFDNSNRVVQISVESADIPNIAGVNVGQPVSKVAQLPGANRLDDIDMIEVGDLYFSHNGQSVTSVIAGEPF